MTTIKVSGKANKTVGREGQLILTLLHNAQTVITCWGKEGCGGEGMLWCVVWCGGVWCGVVWYGTGIRLGMNV